MVKVEFDALVKNVSSKALVSGDKSFKIELVGEDGRMLECGTLPGDAMVKVTIELHGDSKAA